MPVAAPAADNASQDCLAASRAHANGPPDVVALAQVDTAQAQEEASSRVGSGTSLSPSLGASSRWRTAGKKVQVGLALSSRLNTLRDRYGVNEIAESELKMVKKLGEGAFATVEQCLYTPKSGAKPVMVAVKKLKPEVKANEEDMVSFMSEVALMRKLKHSHIVEYVGIGSTDRTSEEAQRNSMFLVSELMDGGTLKKLVMKQMTCMHQELYSNDDALRWCSQVAGALAYLHNSRPQVIHRDLKLENVLLKGVKEKGDRSAQTAKLSDFGLVALIGAAKTAKNPGHLSHAASARSDESRWTENTKMYLDRLESLASGIAVPEEQSAVLEPRTVQQLSGRTGTLMYMAPEMYKGEHYDEKVDVFSFGVILYELLHKYMMIFAVSVAGTEEEIEQYAAKVSTGWRPPLSEKFAPDVLQIIRDAWAQDAKDRPSMQEIYERLERIRTSKCRGYTVAGEAEAPRCECIIC